MFTLDQAQEIVNSEGFSWKAYDIGQTDKWAMIYCLCHGCNRIIEYDKTTHKVTDIQLA